MVYLAFFVAGIFALLIYLIDAWAQTHGLAVLSGDHWVIVAFGWPMVKSFFVFFFAAGASIGGLLSWVAGSRCWMMFQEISDAEVEEQRQVLKLEIDKAQQERVALRKERHSLADEILVASNQAREQAFSISDQKICALEAQLVVERNGRRSAETLVKQRDEELKGARGKAQRWAAKAKGSTADEPFWGETGSGPVR